MADRQPGEQIIGFNMSEKDLINAINKYKDGVYNGDIVNPCPSSFYTFAGLSVDIVRELLVTSLGVRSAYKGRAVALKNMLEWLRSEMSTEAHWTQGKTAKTIFLLKQDWGDGVKLEDKPTNSGSGGAKSLSISFGDGSKRSAKAGK